MPILDKKSSTEKSIREVFRKMTEIGKIVVALVITATGCVLAAGCASDSSDSSALDSGAFEQKSAAADDPALGFNLDPEARDIPFPSLVFQIEDAASPTGRRVNVDDYGVTYLAAPFANIGSTSADFNRLDGFGLAAPIWFHTNAVPDQTMFPAPSNPSVEDAVFCAVLADEDHSHYSELWPLRVSYIEDVGLIQVVPYLPLAQNTAYACVVSDRLTTADGGSYTVPEDLTYILSSTANPSHPRYTLLEPFRLQFEPYVIQLTEEYGVDTSQIIGFTVFHTQWVTHDLESIREQLAQTALDEPPAIGEWTRDFTYLKYADSVWETPYETINWQTKGVFAADTNGDPLPNGTMPVTLRLVLPSKDVCDRNPPYPVVIFGHGLTGERGRGDEVMNTLAGECFASVAIDWLYHGDRMQPPQGLDPSLAYLIQLMQFTPLLVPAHTRDNFRQGVADILWLKHVVRNLDELDLAPAWIGGDGVPDLDTEHISYVGISMGAAHGTMLAAIEPEFPIFLLMSGAANWPRNIFEGDPEAVIVYYVRDLLEFIGKCLGFDFGSEIDLLYQILLTVAGAGDPYNYASFVIKEPLNERPGGPLHLLHQMAANDIMIGTVGGAEFSRSMGLTLLHPYLVPIEQAPLALAPFDGPATFQFATDDHTFMIDRADRAFQEGHHQMAVFMRTAYEQDQTLIINPYK